MSNGATALLIIAAILGIILLLRFGVDAVYENDILTVRAQLNFIYIKVFSTAPKKKKKKKPEKEKKPKKKKPKKDEEKPPKPKKPKKKMTLDQILELVGMLSKAVKRVLKGVRVDNLEAQITLAGDDPAKLAILYGELSAASGTVHSLLDNLINLKTYSVLFDTDFCGGKTKANGRVHITLTNFAILCAVFGLLFAFIKYSRKYKKPADKHHGGKNERRNEASGRRNNESDNGEDQADG